MLTYARRWFMEASKHNVSAGRACYNLALFCEAERAGESYNRSTVS